MVLGNDNGRERKVSLRLDAHGGDSHVCPPPFLGLSGLRLRKMRCRRAPVFAGCCKVRSTGLRRVLIALTKFAGQAATRNFLFLLEVVLTIWLLKGDSPWDFWNE